METPVLLAVDESTGSLAAVRALARAGYPPHVATPRSEIYAARSRLAASVSLVPDAGRAPEGFAGAVGRLAERLGVVAVLPATESSLSALTGREDSLPAGVRAGTCPPDVLAAALDKTTLPRLASAAGLEVPRTLEIGLARRDQDVSALGFPAVLKPPSSVMASERGGLRTQPTRTVRTADEVRQALHTGPPEGPWLLQQWIAGTLYAACGVVWRGDVVCSLQQASPRIWPPEIGGSSYAVVVRPDPDVEAGVRNLLGEIGWSGIFCVQFLRTPERSYLIDLNPRVYGSLALAVHAGHNLPAIWTDLLLGRKPRLGDLRIGTRFRAEEDDVRALLHAFRNRDRSGAIRALVPRRHTVHPVWWWRDPRPAAVTLRKAVARARSARTAAPRST